MQATTKVKNFENRWEKWKDLRDCKCTQKRSGQGTDKNITGQQDFITSSSEIARTTTTPPKVSHLVPRLGTGGASFLRSVKQRPIRRPVRDALPRALGQQSHADPGYSTQNTEALALSRVFLADGIARISGILQSQFWGSCSAFG